MNAKLIYLLAASITFSLTAFAQEEGGPPPPGQTWQNGSRGGRGGGFGGMMGGRGTIGTVTAVADDHLVIKTDSGELRTVNFSANTRMIKQSAQPRSEGGQRTPPQPIKPADIKVGDAIAASGELDDTGKTIGAVMIVQLDPERAKQMREMQANFGKTWLMGKVVSVHDTEVTLQSQVDNASHTFVADENTSFKKRRDFITLADVQVGDNVRVDGAVKQGVFVATTVNVMGMPRGGEGQQPMRDRPPQ